MSKVSVIIPCYNQGKYIDEAVSSVLSQTYKSFEIIIVNDGSTDKFTNELLKTYSRPKTRIIFTRNRGVSTARNLAISESKGEYILPLDADDKIAPEYLEKAMHFFENDIVGDVGIVYCLAEFFGKKSGLWNLPEFSFEEILLRNMIFCSAFFRKSDWQKVGGYNDNMKDGYEDWDFWLSLIEAGVGVYKIPDVLFYYRIKRGSRCNAMSEKEKFEMRLQIFDNHEKLYRDNLKSIFRYLDFDDVKNSKSYLIGKSVTRFLEIFIL